MHGVNAPICLTLIPPRLKMRQPFEELIYPTPIPAWAPLRPATLNP